MKRASLSAVVIVALLAGMVLALVPAVRVQAAIYWSANITASTTFLVGNVTAPSSDSCLAAVAGDALTGFDDYDATEPPHAANNWVSAYFEYTLWGPKSGEYHRDTRPIPAPGATENWIFTVETDITTNSTNPMWINVASANATGGFELFDLDPSVNATVIMPYSYWGDVNRDFRLTFRGDTEAPPDPALVTPADAATTTSLMPTFTWTAVVDDGGVAPSGVDHYVLQIADNTTFAAPVLDKNTGNVTTYTLLESEALDVGTYYWRVAAVDAAQNSSGTDGYTPAYRTFTTQKAGIAWAAQVTGTGSADSIIVGVAPDASTLADAYDVADTTVGTAVDLRSDIGGADYEQNIKPTAANVTWDFEVETTATGSVNLTCDLTPTGLTGVPAGYGVTLLDAAGTTELALYTLDYTHAATANVAVAFKLNIAEDTTAPPAPTLSQPVGDAFIGDSTPTFLWGAVEDASGVKYTIVWDDSDDCLSPVGTKADLTAAEYTLAPALAVDGRYYWQVTAIDGAGLETQSAIASFQLDTTAPGQVSLTSPAAGETTPDRTPTFTWVEVVDPSGVTYTLELDNDSNCLTPLVTEAGLGATTYTLTGGEALAEGTYYWRVGAIDSVGNEGAWSAIRTFTVQGGVLIYHAGVWTGDVYDTIGLAIAAAEANDVLIAGAGTYRDLVTVNKDITLKSAEGAAETIIDVTGKVVESNAVTITAAGVTLGEKGLGFTITGASDSGVKVDAPGCNIVGNIIGSYKPETTTYTNDIGISLTGSGTSCTIKYNDIVGNTSYGVSSAVAVAAKYNWWGDVSGPAGIGPGAGDIVTTNVAYEPWLTKASATVLDSGFAYFGYELSLGEEWNIFSTPFAVDTPADTWGELEALGDGLSLHATSPVYYYDPAQPVASRWQSVTSTTKIDPLKAYYVRMASADKASMLLNPIGFVTEAAVSAGWNLIGLSCLPDEALYMKATEALADIYYGPDGVGQGYTRVRSPDNCNQPADWWYYWDGGINSDHTANETGWLHVGHGYWVFMKTSSTLGAHVTYPVLLPD